MTIRFDLLASAAVTGISFYALGHQGFSLGHAATLASLVGILPLAVVWATRPMRRKPEVTSTPPSPNTYDACPDCGAGTEHFLAGPQGGMSINVLCDKCHNEFNIMALEFPQFLLIDRLGKALPPRLRMYGIEVHDPLLERDLVPDVLRLQPTGLKPGQYQFRLDGRPAGPIRDTLGEAHGDAVQNGYAVYTEDGIKLDATQGAEIARG